MNHCGWLKWEAHVFTISFSDRSKVTMPFLGMKRDSIGQAAQVISI